MLRFKLVITIIFIFNLSFMTSCKNSTDTDDGQNSEKQTFTSANIKTEGTQYFSFSENSATAQQPQTWDLTFTMNNRAVEVGVNSCVYFEVTSDPIIKGAPDLTLAKTAAVSLDEVKQLPAGDSFVADDTLREATIGKNWFDPQNGYAVRPDVYVLKTCSGNFALLQVKRFDFDNINFQISNIHFDFKLNANGSTDFTMTSLDSSQSGNAYTQNRYFSFATGSLDYGYGSWDLQFEGSALWLGPNTLMKKIENKNIEDVGSISDTGFTGDHLPSYMTAGWYDSDESHHVIPNDFVYFIHTKDGKYVAFEITNYYDDMGISGAFTMEWKYMTP